MPRLFYLAERIGVHERRILAKFAEAGWGIASTDGSTLGIPSFPLTDAAATTARERFRACLADARPDLVLSGPLHTAGWLAATAGARPLVQVSMAYDLLWNAERDPADRTRIAAALAGADLLLADCEAVREAAARLAPALPAVTIPFGIDLRAVPFRERPPGSSPTPEPFTVLSPRSWEPLYAVEIVLAAFARAREEEPGLRLVLAGDGSRRGAVEAEIARLGLRESVSLPGRYDAAGWVRLAAGADLYLSCARTDGTSISLLEAMASGLPAAVTDIPSNREWVEEGAHGWLAPADDAGAFARAIVAAARLSPEARREIGRRNRRAVETRADWDRNFPRFLDACLRLTSAPDQRF